MFYFSIPDVGKKQFCQVVSREEEEIRRGQVRLCNEGNAAQCYFDFHSRSPASSVRKEELVVTNGGGGGGSGGGSSRVGSAASSAAGEVGGGAAAAGGGEDAAGGRLLPKRQRKKAVTIRAPSATMGAL